MPTIYEQLQEVLNELIEKGWKPWGIDGLDYVSSIQVKITDGYYVLIDLRRLRKFTIHDLFSKDSGFMESVERKSEGKMIMIDAEIIQDSEGLPGVDAKESADDFDPKYRYMDMGPMAAEEKVKYVLDNIIR